MFVPITKEHEHVWYKNNDTLDAYRAFGKTYKQPGSPFIRFFMLGESARIHKGAQKANYCTAQSQNLRAEEAPVHSCWKHSRFFLFVFAISHFGARKSTSAMPSANGCVLDTNTM